jgi:uncharacterized protein (DUF362 family)
MRWYRTWSRPTDAFTTSPKVVKALVAAAR